jgi:uncharacterized membrane protein YczE
VRRNRLAARLARLYLGLAAFGVSLALMVRARLGLGPWDVLHQGIARHLGIQLGWVTIAVSALVLLAWIPLRQRPGLGTVSNAIAVGLIVNGALDVLPTPGSLAWRTAWLAGGIGLNGLATACYLGAGLGPGPRDGLMTAIAARGHSLRAVRTLMELSVLAAGIALGGAVGVGTVAYALSIGPLTHLLLPWLTVRRSTRHQEHTALICQRLPDPSPPDGRLANPHEEHHRDRTDLWRGRAHVGRPGRESGRHGPGSGAAGLRLCVHR